MKEREHQQCCTTQLEEFQDVDEKLSLNEVTAVQAVHESQKEVTNNIIEHSYQHDVEECMGIRDKVKAQVKEFK